MTDVKFDRIGQMKLPHKVVTLLRCFVVWQQSHYIINPSDLQCRKRNGDCKGYDSPELVGESIYEGMRRGTLTKDEFCRRMSALDKTPETALGSAYASWLLLRSKPPSAEKELHMEAVKARLLEVARYKEEEARHRPH